MKKKFLFTILSSLFLGSSLVQAQTSSVSVGVDYLRTGELKIAKQIFSNELAQSPAASNYYLGEVAYAEGDVEGAKALYDKSLAADPTFSLALVGQGKYDLKKGDTKAAEDAFSSALKKDKKDIAINVAIADAYFANGQEDKANAKIDEAIKYDKKSPLPYILQGEILEAKGSVGDAAGKYDMANLFDPTNTLAYLKSAKVYENINPDLAIEKLKKVLEINPNYFIAYRELGNINTTRGHYGEAIDAYAEFFKHNAYTVADITHFASDYYFTKKYDQAIPLLKEGLALEPNNFVLNRLYMYCLVDSKDYTNALPVAQKFFSLESKKGDRITQDFMSYGDALAKNNQMDAALDQYNAAIALDPTKVTVYKDIAATLADASKYDQAADFYNKYLTKVDTTLIETTDYFKMGRYYFIAAGALKDSTSQDAKEKVATYLKDADQAFAKVAERKPDSYLGYFWRARTNSKLDPDTKAGLAKPFYEQTIAILMQKDGGANSKAELVECYSYLTIYYFLKGDKSNAIDNCNLWINLDPDNKQPKDILAELKK